MTDWLTELRQLVARGERAVMATVAGTRGSTPREMGAKMIVTPGRTIGSIGGGQLEHQCIREASSWLAGKSSQSSSDRSMLRKMTLGANCGQCCGGVAEILFEEVSTRESEWVVRLAEMRDAHIDVALVTARQSRRSSVRWLVTPDDVVAFGDAIVLDHEAVAAARSTIRSETGVSRIVARPASNVELPLFVEAVREPDFHVVVFGAGHVGSACAAALSLLDVRVDLVDSRNDAIPGNLPANIAAHFCPEPAGYLSSVLPGAYFLVMTHDHGLDFEICTKILRRGDFSFCGLIGSRSKRRRFERRLRSLGFSQAEIGRITCPIGIDEIRGKKPGEIAISVAAQLQGLRDSIARSSALAAPAKASS